MSLDRRLLGLLSSARGDMVLGVAAATATLVAGIALAASSAFLISRAALVTAFVEVAVLVTAVRAFAIGRAALRYVERYVTHRATLRIQARLRSWTFAALVPRLPATRAARSSGDLLAVLGADVETLDRYYLRAVVPPLAAVGAGVVAIGVLALIAPAAGAVLAVGLLGAGIALPLATHRLARRRAKDALIADRVRPAAPGRSRVDRE
jgi:ABC-type transport system involved in cytochrome bd biosynthesis fused ATPase/permease subunit